MDDRPRADLRARPDVGPGGDGGGRMDLRALVNQRAFLDARFEDQLAEKKRARFGEGDVRLDGDDARRGARHVLLRGLVDDDRSRPRFGKRSSVAWIRVERHLLRPCRLERRDSGHAPRAVPAQLRADAAGEVLERQLRHFLPAGFFSGAAFFSGALPAGPEPKRSL